MGFSCIGKCSSKTVQLVRLSVSGGGVKEIKGIWFTSTAGAGTVDVTAVTSPNDDDTWRKIIWTGAAPDNNAANIVPLDRTSVMAPQKISAALKRKSKSVNVCIVNIIELKCENGIKLSDVTWKFYRADKGNAELLATSSYNIEKYSNDFTWVWDKGTEGKSKRRRKLPLNVVADTTIEVKLFDDKKQIMVRVVQVPVLKLKKVSFYNGYSINCDTLGNFDNVWEDGRTVLAAGAVAAPNTYQSPLLFVQNHKIQVIAEFTVSTPPTVDEEVTIRGTATFKGVRMKWEQTKVKVKASDATVATAAMDSDVNLPDKVTFAEDFTIQWEVVGPDGVTKSVGKSVNWLYVGFAAPVGNIYWTLIDIACRGGEGAQTEVDFVKKSYKPFASNVGDGKGFKRLRDNTVLSYYPQGSSTRATADVYSAAGMLGTGNADGAGRCGGWADLLVTMWRSHGVGSASDFGVVPKVTTALGYQMVFLVQNCKFNGSGTLNAPFTHKGNSECVKQSGAAGQGKTNPQFVFADHALVEYTTGSHIFDPSYGTGPFNNLTDWEKPSIAGLGYWHNLVTFSQSGTSHFIPFNCSEGFILHKMAISETLATVATKYGVSSAKTLYEHPYNLALQTAHGAKASVGIPLIPTGEIIVIPKKISNITILRR